jgi:hypothetical protein
MKIKTKVRGGSFDEIDTGTGTGGGGGGGRGCG